MRRIAALGAVAGSKRLADVTADGQYLGWRVGITADGTWRFFVQGD